MTDDTERVLRAFAEAQAADFIASPPPSSLAAALAALQAELPPVTKNKTAKVKGTTKDGRTFDYTYKYADLADVSATVMPLMGKLGLSFTCQPTRGEQGFGLAYQLLHSSGEVIDGFYPLDEHMDVQRIGGHITYARRYVLCAITGVAAEEDTDAQDTGKDAEPAPKRRRESPPVRGKDELPRNRDGSVSRSRTTDAELDASGQMTDAQIREHGRLERDVKGTGPQGTERLDGTPDDDPWYQEPPTPVRQPRAAQDPARTIAMHFARLGVDDRDVRLGYTAQLAGRDQLASTKDLTAAEGLAVLAALGRCKDQPALLALLEEPPL